MGETSSPDKESVLTTIGRFKKKVRILCNFNRLGSSPSLMNEVHRNLSRQNCAAKSTSDVSDVNKNGKGVPKPIMPEIQ